EHRSPLDPHPAGRRVPAAGGARGVGGVAAAVGTRDRRRLPAGRRTARPDRPVPGRVRHPRLPRPDAAGLRLGAHRDGVRPARAHRRQRAVARHPAPRRGPGRRSVPALRVRERPAALRHLEPVRLAGGGTAAGAPDRGRGRRPGAGGQPRQRRRARGAARLL
ncbi:MAG: hypothetical protein AVDCRST_MAG16-2528, partial [uncultured Frankineae bacterium]